MAKKREFDISFFLHFKFKNLYDRCRLDTDEYTVLT